MTENTNAEDIRIVKQFHAENAMETTVTLTVGDLWTLMGACARDSFAWEKKAARAKTDFTREQHLFQAKSYTEMSDKLYAAIRAARQEVK